MEEIDELLRNLTGELGEEAGPLGLRLERAAAWPHIQVRAPELGRLLLDPSGERAHDEAPRAGGELWIGLANLALSADGQWSPDGADPLVLARAIDEQVGQVAYDRVVLDYLGQMAEEISGRPGAWEPRARERVSRLMASLRPDTLRRLLEAGGDHAERRRFALTASEVLAVDAVVEVVEAAAATTGQNISHHLLRLLHKFAHHAEQSGGTARAAEAESVLRKNVAQLIANWELADPNPAEYTAVLEGMVRQAPPERADEPETDSCEAETVVQIALETGCTGPRVFAAVDRLISEGNFGRLGALLADAPVPGVADAVWRSIATLPRLRSALAATPVDFTAVEGMALRLGACAADPLLDYLESAADQTSRARALKVLTAIGPSSLVPAAARFPGAPWYVQRNILVLHQALNAWPAGFSPISCTMHAHPQVRREAYKLLLKYPQHRASAVAHGLKDREEGIVRLVLLATLEACPPEVVKAVEAFLGERHRPPELRALAVRVLARVSGAEGVPRLMDLAGERRIFRGWRLAPKSPIVLAALGALAQFWPSHPSVAGLLELARRHPDPDFRIAVEARLA